MSAPLKWSDGCKLCQCQKCYGTCTDGVFLIPTTYRNHAKYCNLDLDEETVWHCMACAAFLEKWEHHQMSPLHHPAHVRCIQGTERQRCIASYHTSNYIKYVCQHTKQPPYPQHLMNMPVRKMVAPHTWTKICSVHGWAIHQMT